MLSQAVLDDRPVFLIENKLMYGRPNRRPEGGYVDEFRCTESAGRYPALTFSGNELGGGVATIVTYGGMLPLALAAAAELILEHEVFCEIVALSQLLPVDRAGARVGHANRRRRDGRGGHPYRRDRRRGRSAGPGARLA